MMKQLELSFGSIMQWRVGFHNQESLRVVKIEPIVSEVNHEGQVFVFEEL